MKYDAITLDTNIFRQNSYNLESGLLGQLAQFKEGSVQLVLSEIVIRELKRHLIRDSHEMRLRLETSLKDAKKSCLLPDGVLENINTLIAAEADAATAAKNRLIKFIEDTGAKIVEAKHTSMESLVKSYFDALAPFEESGKKKNEFPDAIALLSLNDWAQKNNKKILAVSEDKGWHDYATGSDGIDAEKDLSKTFQMFQEDVGRARKVISGLLSALSQGNNPDLLDEMDKHIQGEVESLDPYVDAQSYLSYDEEIESLYCENFEFLENDDDYEFTITQIGVNKIVVKIPLCMQIKASANFNFYVYDSIDKDNVSMGGDSIETEDTLHISALVTFEGNFNTSPAEVSISKLVLLESSPTINFGNIEPFTEQDYEEYQ
jgi:hypothetical protein